VARRRKRRRLGRLILWVGLALLIAGFIVRRTYAPLALYYLTHRAPSPSQPMSGSGATAQSPDAAQSGSAERTAQGQPANPAPEQNLSDARPSQPQASGAVAPPPSEKLTDADRQALDEILRRKSK